MELLLFQRATRVASLKIIRNMLTTIPDSNRGALLSPSHVRHCDNHGAHQGVKQELFSSAKYPVFNCTELLTSIITSLCIIDWFPLQ